MIFNQFEFIFLFLPAVLVLFFLSGMARWRPTVLLGSSLIFYGLSGLEHATVLVVGATWVWLVSRSPRFMGSRWRLLAAIIVPLAALVYYKYLGFIISQFIGGTREDATKLFSIFGDIILPAGISFFTFQLMSFAIDRWKGEIPQPPPLSRLLLFISFFPQLVAGPILHWRDADQSLANLPRFTLDPSAAGRGIGLICMGLAGKVLIADTLAIHIAPFIPQVENLAALDAAYVILSYSFRLYFDFYGYSLIAIGLGLLFGFSLPNNFNRPYESLNPKDFWRRWHITLSSWIRDYLYIPLGGHHKYIRNIIFIFIVCGLWHGAGWNFIIWGAYHAILVTGYHAVARQWDALPALLQRVTTFSLVSVGWLLFQFDLARAVDVMGCLFGHSGAAATLSTPTEWSLVLAAAIACFAIHPEAVARRLSDSGRWLLHASLYAALGISCILLLDRSQSFIYFRF